MFRRRLPEHFTYYFLVILSLNRRCVDEGSVPPPVVRRGDRGLTPLRIDLVGLFGIFSLGIAEELLSAGLQV